MAHLVIKKIVREHVQLEPSKDGKTFGQCLDETIAAAISNHDEVNEILFGFEGDQWFTFLNSSDADIYRTNGDVMYADDGLARPATKRKL